MSEKERNFMVEREKSPTFDGIAVLGRGIEKVQTSSGEKWQPTRAIEKMTGGYHSGKRELGIIPQDEDESVVVAGANANVIAATELFERLRKEGAAPSLIIFSAGRPAYLGKEIDPNLSEGGYWQKNLAKKLRRK